MSCVATIRHVTTTVSLKSLELIFIRLDPSPESSNPFLYIVDEQETSAKNDALPDSISF